jgi:hypothetical protein
VYVVCVRAPLNARTHDKKEEHSYISRMKTSVVSHRQISRHCHQPCHDGYLSVWRSTLLHLKVRDVAPHTKRIQCIHGPVAYHVSFLVHLHAEPQIFRKTSGPCYFSPLLDCSCEICVPVLREPPLAPSANTPIIACVYMYGSCFICIKRSKRSPNIDYLQ